MSNRLMSRRTDGRPAGRGWRRPATLAFAVAAAALALAAPAGAHVGVSPTEAPADDYAKLDFSVPHGCDGSLTTQLRIRIPRSVPSVTPQIHPGWDVSTQQGPKDPVKLHGERIARGVSEIVWTAADAGPLPDGLLEVFGASVRLPAGQPGDVLHFPAIQRCADGVTRWIQVPAAGESAHDLDEPAPAVTLTASEGHGAGGEATTEEVDVEPAAAAVAAADGDGPSTGLAIAALALGALGLLAGLTALWRGAKQ